MSDGLEAARPRRVAALCGAAVAAAVAVFGLGVTVGRRSVETPPVVAPPAALPTEGFVPQPASPPPVPVPALDLPRSPAAAPAAAPAPSPDPGKLTFYDRLSGRAPAEPAPVPADAPPAPTAAATPAPPAVESARSTTATVPPPPAVPPAAPAAKVAKAAAPAPAPPPAEAPAGDPAARIRKLAGKGPYAVQVAAVAQKAAANETMERLRSLGLTPTLVMVTVKGKTLYRVRVGSFPDQASAWKATDIFRGPLKMAGSIPVR